MLFEKRYFFRGSAVGFAANLHHFDEDAITVDTCFEGSAALPPTGGCLQSTSGAREIRHPEHGFFLSFESSSAIVKGDLPDRSGRNEDANRLVKRQAGPRVRLQTSVTKLKVEENGLEIDQLSCHVLSEDPRNFRDDDDELQVVFSHVEPPVISGVTVAGRPLTIEFDPYLIAVPTQRKLMDDYENSDDFRKEYRDRFFGEEESDGDDLPLINGYAATTIVKRITFGDDELDRKLIVGVNRIFLEGFGTIIFGELLIGANARELSLVRLQLGSDLKGDATAGYCSSRPEPGETP